MSKVREFYFGDMIHAACRDIHLFSTNWVWECLYSFFTYRRSNARLDIHTSPNAQTVVIYHKLSLDWLLTWYMVELQAYSAWFGCSREDGNKQVDVRLIPVSSV